MTHWCCGDCNSKGDCCSKGMIHAWPLAAIADGAKLNIDFTSHWSVRHTLEHIGERTTASYSFNFNSSAESDALSHCVDTVTAVASDSASGASGEAEHDVSIVVTARPSGANVLGTGHANASGYTFATGFSGQLFTVTMGGEVLSDTIDHGHLLNNAGQWFAETFILGFPCSGLIGFAALNTTTGDPGNGNHLLDPFGTDRIKSPVVTPYTVITSGIEPSQMGANRSAAYTRFDSSMAGSPPELLTELFYVQTTNEMAHARSGADDLGTLSVKKSVQYINNIEREGSDPQRSHHVWSCEAEIALSLVGGSSATYNTLVRCPDFDEQVGLYCDGVTDCCDGSLVCSKAVDEEPIVHKTTMRSDGAVVVAVAADVDDPDVTLAGYGVVLPGDDGGPIVPGPQEVETVGTVVNESNPCLPPGAFQAAATRESHVYGIDATGLFALIGRETLQVRADGSPDARRISGQWTYGTDLVKTRPGSIGGASGAPTGNFLLAQIRFVYDTTVGSFNTTGSNLVVFGANDSGWGANVLAGLDRFATSPCLTRLDVFSDGIESGETLTRADMSVVPRISVSLRAIFELLNVVECPPMASPVVLPTPAQSKAIASSRKGCRGCGGRKGTGGRRG